MEAAPLAKGAASKTGEPLGLLPQDSNGEQKSNTTDSKMHVVRPASHFQKQKLLHEKSRFLVFLKIRGSGDPRATSVRWLVLVVTVHMALVTRLYFLPGPSTCSVEWQQETALA